MLSENKRNAGQNNSKHHGKKLQKYEKTYVHVNNMKFITTIALGSYQQTKALTQ